MGVDVTRFVCRALNGGDDDIMMRAVELRGSPARGPASWWADRLGLAKRTVFAPLRARFAHHAEPLSSSIVVFDVTLDAENMEHRASFVRHHFGQDVDFVSAATPRVPPSGRPGPWLRWYFVGVWAAILALLDFSDRRHFWLGALLLEVQALARAVPHMRTAYVFRLFDARPYLAATFLARHTDVDVVCVFQNIPLWRNCRYFHLGTPVVMTSKVNLPEVEHFAKLGWFISGDIRYRSQEYVGVMPSASEPIVDIGYISTGEWARRDGLYQVKDIEAIRRGEHHGNVYAQRVDWLIAVLVSYARNRGLRLRIYPHPYERTLLAQHGIAAPYATLVDGEAVTLDAEGGDSRQKIYEMRAAVSLQSSFIWERLDLDLRASFIYEFSDQGLNVFDRGSLGEYAANAFCDQAELYRELDAVFASPAG